MTFKDLFDQALAKCDKFESSQYNAKCEFGNHVNALLKPIVENCTYFDQIHCYVGYGRDSDPTIALIMNSTPVYSYLQVPGVTFKISCMRGQKHHSYYSDWCEYKVKGYSSIKIHGYDEEESARIFDTMDILDVIKTVYDNNSLVQQNVKTALKYAEFENQLNTQYSALITKLIDGLTEYQQLDTEVKQYIRRLIDDKTDVTISVY